MGFFLNEDEDKKQSLGQPEQPMPSQGLSADQYQAVANSVTPPDYKTYMAEKQKAVGLGDEQRAALAKNVDDAAPADWRQHLMAASGGNVKDLFANQESARAKLKDFDTRRSGLNDELTNEKKYKDMQNEDAQRVGDDDVNSLSSKMYQGLMGKIYPGQDFSNLTAAQGKKIFPQAESYYKIQQDAVKHKDEVNSKNTAKAENDAKKTTEAQAKAYSAASKDMQTFKGNKAVQNANEALRNSDSAMAIINSVDDPNALTNEQYSMLLSEVGKIAQGGPPTEGTLHDMKANTLKSTAAGFLQKVSGKPTPAQLGEFVKQNKDYLNHLSDINHKFVDDFTDNTLRGYKHLLNPEDYQEISNHLNEERSGRHKSDKEKKLHNVDDMPEIN